MLWPSSLPEELGQLVVADEQRLVLAVGQRGIGQRVLDAIDLRARVEQRLERERRLVDERPARVLEAVLRQIADRQPRGLDDVAAVGLVEAGEHAQQRRLAGAVRAAQADAVAVGDLPGDVVEQDAFAERLGEAGELNHEVGGDSASGSVGRPTARAPSASMRGSRNGLVR